ncbi:MAG: hypothetical protein H0Z35_09740 [Thermoanaerobacteraceae bacterium]|nr:hypothetical protein [Thermoanaerobacteraceae bacterium]
MRYKGLLVILIFILLIIGCNSSPPALTEQEARNLIIKSDKLLSLLATGGNNPTPIFLGPKEQVLDDRINTKEKVMHLLQEVYTENRAKEIYEHFKYNEVDGKMFKPSYDMPNNAIEEKTKIRKIEVNGDQAQVIYTQPLYYSTIKETDFAVKKAFFKYERNSWRLSDIEPIESEGPRE